MSFHDLVCRPLILPAAVLLATLACGPSAAEPYDPRSIEGDIPTVLDALRSGRPQAALTAIDQLISADMAPPGILHYRGLAYADLGNNERALESFRSEIELHPGNGRAHGMAADALLQLGRLEEAQAHIDSGRLMATDFPFLVLVAGRAARLQGDAPLARNAYETYLKADSWSPLAAEAHYSLAQLAIEQGEQQSAREHQEQSEHLERIHQYLNRYRERLAKNPDDTTAALGVAKIFLDLYRSVKQETRFLDQAEASLQRVLSAEPENTAALFDMSFLRMVQERHDEALEGYTAVARLDPLHVGSRLNAGMLLRERGRPAEALPFLEQASQLAQETARLERALYERARCLEEIQRPEEAAQIYRQLLALPPEKAWDAQTRLQQLGG
ncbi:MAG: tetratricopeptide repeat protein [Planctomycetota bacterium]|nr:tetratricopeptide repeat protein [Planctomycetota bacterium]